MASQTQTPSPLHLLFFPFLARSHMIPMLETARIAAARGVKITIVTTTANANLVHPTIQASASAGHQMDLLLIPFRCPDFGLPEGCENITVLPPSLFVNFYSAVEALHIPLDHVIRDHQPDALISDELLFWTTELARDHGIPRIIFQVSGFFPLCVMKQLELHRPHEKVTRRDEPFHVPGFPHHVELTKSKIPEMFAYPFMFDKLKEAELTSYGVIVNSFYKFEPDYAELYYKLCPQKVFCVGPVCIADKGDDGERGSGGDRHGCLSWLDSRKPNSVVYASFGTLARFSGEQLREIALGLEASNHPFIWVAGRGGCDWLPEGFEERVEGKGKGLVVREWAPQVEILNHPAVGGFVVHCGWGSVTEGVSAGLPMLTCPVHSEHFVLEKLLVEVLGIAIAMWEGFNSIWDDEKVVIPAEVVAKGVGRLMGGGEEVEAMRRKVVEYSKMAKAAVEVDGSSYNDMTNLIQGIAEEKNRARKSQ